MSSTEIIDYSITRASCSSLADVLMRGRLRTLSAEMIARIAHHVRTAQPMMDELLWRLNLDNDECPACGRRNCQCPDCGLQCAYYCECEGDRQDWLDWRG